MPDYAARIRAARLYADLTQQELADALGVDVQTVKRREAGPGHEQYKEPKLGERLAIAAVCGVPVDFMEHGFGGRSRDEISERLAGVEQALRELLVSSGSALQQPTSRLPAPPLPTAADPDVKPAPPSVQDPRRTGSGPGEGRRQGSGG